MTAAEVLPIPTIPTLTLQEPAEVVLLPWHRLHSSPLNPRKTFNHAKLVELARNIHARTVFDEAGNVVGTGLLQNLNARADGERGEIAAGERRYQAVGLLVAGLEVDVPDGQDEHGRPRFRTVRYQVPDTYPMPVRLEALTDAELIELATVENVQRDDLTPLEQADAFLALQQAGRSMDQIALRYGQHPNTIRARMQLASGLGQAGRRALEAEEISLEQAQIVSGSTGALKKLLLDHARQGASATTLRHLTRQASFLVEHALFPLEGSGLRIEEGLLGDFPPRFADPRKALALQLEALNWLKSEAEGQGQQVEIVPVEEDYPRPSGHEWASPWNNLPEGVPTYTLLAVSTRTGQVQRYEGMARWRDVQAQRQVARGSEDTLGPERHARRGGARGVREAAHVLAHQTRALALDGYHATHPRDCLALGVVSLLLRATGHEHQALVGLRLAGRREVPLAPETQALAGKIAARFPALFEAVEGGLKVLDHAGLYVGLTGDDVGCADLAEVWTYCTHREVGAWTHNLDRPSAALNALARTIGADADLVRRFELSEAFLDAHTSEELARLIATMPEACRPVYRHNASKKDLKAVILERAAALKAAGWVPALVTFAA